MVDPENPFTKMQQEVYARDAKEWSPANRDPVVGSWDAHESWPDYDLLFEGIDTKDMRALDFGCGPGRMVVRYSSLFDAVDGADIDPTNVKNARRYCEDNGIPSMASSFYPVNGVELDTISSESYDLVFSTICLQHIPVYDIRLNLFKEFHRVLVPGGWLTFQTGYGDEGDPRGVGYFDNKWDAEATNGGCDVKVTSTEDVYDDLLTVGFSPGTFKAVIRPAGPNDWHPNWVFFRCRKGV